MYSKGRASKSKGFTLIEVLIAMGVMVVGVVGVAGMFSYSTRTNVFTEQMTTATLLANGKVEELSALPPPNLTVGGGLDPASPTTGYFEYISVATDGTITTSVSDASLPFLRLWQIDGANPKRITVAVGTQFSGMSGLPVELIRTTMLVTDDLWN